jgi:anti-sigma factor RsiW
MACLDYKDQLTGAALESLAPGEGAHGEAAHRDAMPAPLQDVDLRAHLNSCAACAAEFARTRLLLSAIDRGIEASVGGEPSPEMMARFRRRISEEPAPHSWIGMWIPVAAAALAVAAFLWLGIRSGPRHTWPASSHEAAANSAPAQTPRGPESNTATANLAPPVPSHVGASRALKPGGRLDVLVPPGQMAAVLELQAALRNGSVEPSSIVPDQEDPGAPLDIARLKISPLEFPKLDAAEADAKNSVNR